MYKIHKIAKIMHELKNAIHNKTPFSLIRFGDGGIKLMHSVFYNDDNQLDLILEREGIPKEKVNEILELWGKYANEANYIDTPIVYFTNTFWGRYMKGTYKKISAYTTKRLLMWEDLYTKCGINIKNINFCNPEANWLSILKNYPHDNLLDIMKDKKICCISTYDHIPRLRHYDITYHQIVGHNENQYKNSFNETIKYINSHANDYDLWLNSSGELGRIYSGLIKSLGGRVFDTGFVIDYFINSNIHERLKSFIKQNAKNPNEIVLKKLGYKYKRSI